VQVTARHLRTLKLGQLLATLPDRFALARQNKLPHADFLELPLSDEVTRRENGSAARRARAAGLDPQMRLDHLNQWGNVPRAQHCHHRQ